MFTERNVHVRDYIARRVSGPRADSPFKSVARIRRPIHSRVGDCEAKGWPAVQFLRSRVKLDRIIESSHLSIDRGQQRFAVDKGGIELERARACFDRFVDHAEVTIKLARGVAHPK